MILLMSRQGLASLASDVSAGMGVGSNTIALTQTQQTVTSNAILDFSYNAYYTPMRSAFILSFNENLRSNVGNLNFTRLGLGIRWYVFGYNGDRTVFDSNVEGRIFRPAPFLSLTLGGSTLSVPRINSDSRQYFNAMAYDIDIRAGIEVPLNSRYYLVTQLASLSAFPTYNPQTKENLSYQGLNLFLGIKATSF
jgi:hypothetical protein